MEDKLWLVSLIKGMHLLEEDLRRGGREAITLRERGRDQNLEFKSRLIT